MTLRSLRYRSGAALLGVTMVAAAPAMIAETALAQAPGQPARCAHVDIGLLPGMTQPQQHCFRLDMTCPPASKYGCFKVPLRFASTWIDKPGEPRRRQLTEPFGYIDPTGVHWDVPAGFATDGASIPMFFQLLIGGPWTDNYVKAATLHDFYIRRRSAHADAVHRMFYFALLADGTPPSRAAQMYQAVVHFGPHWKSVDVARVEAAWAARKAMLERVTRMHQQMWTAFQESERRKAEQAAIDRRTLAKPLAARSRHVVIRAPAGAHADVARFIDDALAADIINRERDSSMIQSIQEQLDIELQRPAHQRDNVFILRFLATGAQFSRGRIGSEADLKPLLDLDAQISEQLDRAVLQALPR
jgi:hypothetical protein